MRKAAVWLAGASVVIAVGTTPVAFAAIPDDDGHATTTRTVIDGDHIKQQTDADRRVQQMATPQESHWPSGTRNLTLVDTDPGRGYAEEWAAAVAAWNSANAGITVTYTQGAAPCGNNGTTIAICYTDLPPGMAGQAWNTWSGKQHTSGGYIQIDPEFTDQTTQSNVTCHELGHELGLDHPADGSDGPCSAGQVREDEKQLLREIYGHNDNPAPPPAAACADGVDNDGDGLTDHPADKGCDSPADADETDPAPPAAACADGVDNDGDGLTDHPADKGCDSPADTDETDPAPPAAVCADGVDNDGDGLTDHPADLGCASPADTDETDPAPPAPQCSDGADNDGDGQIDHPADKGCDSPDDNDETDAPPVLLACSDGADNDGDGKTDHPADPGCDSPRDNDESDPAPPTPACQDGLDNDNDGAIDFPDDPGCRGPFDGGELGTAACDDGKDNDKDGKTDLAEDPGCESLTDNVEKDQAPDLAQCADGVDNDGDGKVDFAEDPGCDSDTDTDETDPVATPTDPWSDCALGIFPLICLLPGDGLFGDLFGGFLG